MKTCSKILCFLLFFPPILLFGAGKNFYLDLKEDYIEVGEYVGKRHKKTVFQTFDRNNLDVIGIKNLLIGKDEKILFYIHSMFGGVHLYHKNSLNKIAEIENLDKTISIVWHVDKINYKGAWKLAPAQGIDISLLLKTLLEEKSNDFHMLCHSMGHRIFEGMVGTGNWNGSAFKTIILAAADLDIDIFEKSLVNAPKISERLIIYTNGNDRLLKISSRKLKRKRLGLHGHEKPYCDKLLQIKNLEIVNVTNAVPGRKIRYTNHIYFKNNPNVLVDINRVINGREVERRASINFRKEGYVELK